jgi:predicted O-linked N-acetylglucosamine transferase (SPINDLY family)
MAITLYPFIIASKSEKENEVLMNHERIHLQQEKELFVLPFYILYLGASIYAFFKHFNIGAVYMFNRFETEAYANEKNMEYLKNRKKFAWVKPDETLIIYETELKKCKVPWLERAMTIFILAFVIACVIAIILNKACNV